MTPDEALKHALSYFSQGRKSVSSHWSYNDNTCEEIAAGLKQLSERGEAEREWVKVDDRRPEWDPKADDVLVYTITGHVDTAHPNRICTRWAEAKEHGEDCFYTHWKPLPAGPICGTSARNIKEG